MRYLKCIVWLLAILLLVACGKNGHDLGSLLGIDLPIGTSDIHLELERRPDYNYIEMKAKFRGDKEAWDRICYELKLDQTNAAYLASKNISPRIASWWNAPAPALQKSRAQYIGERGVVYALWWEGFIYIEFSGYPPLIVK